MGSDNGVRQNCWEYMRCGREPGGERAAKLGVCSAAASHELDGIHGGHNGGRACWVVAGSLCKGEPHGTFARRSGCHTCPFYKQVVSEEMQPEYRPGFMFTTQLLRALDGAEPARR